MRAILVRVGVDKEFGNWNAPVDPSTGEFIFVPIPDGDGKVYPTGHARGYEEIAGPLADFALKHRARNLSLPHSLRLRKMHLDPDFDYLTYGDRGTHRGANIATLGRGDMLVFYAGLRSIEPPSPLVYALVGLFVIQEVVRAVDVPVGRIHENAHTRWMPISSQDVIVRGEPKVSGRFDRSIPIGEYRENAYRVRRDVEDAWGGLRVKNGYIQRSAVPPELTNAREFELWLQKQGVALMQRNN
jgi:hypothetical protein